MIAIFGAGAVGCWIGGQLAAGGAEVTLIGRARVMDELRGGLRATQPGGPDVAVEVQAAASPGRAVTATTDPAAAASATIVVVTVKSAQTAAAGAELARVLPAGAVVVSLQNGVRNADTLRAALPDHRVIAAMIPFNIARIAPGVYHRGTSGRLMIADDPACRPLIDACHQAALAIEPRSDMAAVLWAKLVINLNNAVNALSGVPLATELAQRGFRRCVAVTHREALAALAAARQPVAKLTALPPAWIPRVLSLPDALYRRISRRFVAVDPKARSSMWDDLEAGRPTEIDYLQGEIVALAERVGRTAPVNRRMVELVRAAEAGGKRDFTASELCAALGLTA